MRCVHLQCPAQAAGQMDLMINKLPKCRDYVDCIHWGYSVCFQPQNYDYQKRQLITQEDQCRCAHSGPAIATANSTEDQQKCQLLVHSRQTEPQELDIEDESIILRNCYTSAIRKLPTPNATIDAEMSGHPVLVTIDQFWQTDYWKGLRPERLYLFYEFPVSKKEYCEGKVQVLNAQDMSWINAGRDQPAAVRNTGLTWLCKDSLRILMTGIEREEEEETMAQYDQDQQHGQKQTVDANEVDEKKYASNSPTEVKFERDVFAGAKRVRFHYEMMVHRDNLLVRDGGEGKPTFESRKTLIKSGILEFDLHPNTYGNTK